MNVGDQSVTELEHLGQWPARRGDNLAVLGSLADPDQYLRQTALTNELPDDFSALGKLGHVRQRAGGHSFRGAIE
jgi:hypothetical protein